LSSMQLSSAAAGSGAHSPARSNSGGHLGLRRILPRWSRPSSGGRRAYAERRQRGWPAAQAETGRRTVSPAIVHPRGGVSRAAWSEQSSTKRRSGSSRSGLSSISRASYRTTAVVDAGTEQPILEQIRTTGMLDHRYVISSNGVEVWTRAAASIREYPPSVEERSGKRCTPRWPPGRPFGLHGVPTQPIPAGAFAQGWDRRDRAERVTRTAPVRA
jgi:hypothetical protein